MNLIQVEFSSDVALGRIGLISTGFFELNRPSTKTLKFSSDLNFSMNEHLGPDMVPANLHQQPFFIKKFVHVLS